MQNLKNAFRDIFATVSLRLKQFFDSTKFLNNNLKNFSQLDELEL